MALSCDLELPLRKEHVVSVACPAVTVWYPQQRDASFLMCTGLVTSSTSTKRCCLLFPSDDPYVPRSASVVGLLAYAD